MGRKEGLGPAGVCFCCGSPASPAVAANQFRVAQLTDPTAAQMAHREVIAGIIEYLGGCLRRCVLVVSSPAASQLSDRLSLPARRDRQKCLLSTTQ